MILTKLRAHALRFAGLATLTVPSAAISDEEVEAWSAEMYAADLANEPQQRTGEVA